MGSIPITRSNFLRLGAIGKELCSSEARLQLFDLAHIAQVVEHSLGKGEVTGSSPVVGTIFIGH